MKRALIFLFVLSWGGEAGAIVNIENMRTETPAEGVSGLVELAVNGSSGNTQKMGGAAGTRLQWQRDRVTDFAILRYAYGESVGKRDTNHSFLHARHIHPRSSWRADELFIQGETDEFARLSFRGLVGFGERFTLFEAPQQYALNFTAGAFYALEKRDEKFGTTDGGTDRFWRISTALSYKHQINTQVNFISTTYYQPAFRQFSDYRILEEAALSVKLSEQFILKLGLDLVHDSKPPQTVKKTDMVYSTGLEYRF